MTGAQILRKETIRDISCFEVDLPLPGHGANRLPFVSLGARDLKKTTAPPWWPQATLGSHSGLKVQAIHGASVSVLVGHLFASCILQRGFLQ